ncbi:MAG: 30S ribosomal protein S2 [Planctomycetes bacterium]|nr:30S ribosomal protein S2 [Planctomycetota bacterium]
MASALVNELVECGIHFGHRASRWNPKMSPYIFGKRNLIHIIDLRETVKGLLRAKKFIAHVVSEGGDVLFVGTKRQARGSVEDHARRIGMPYVTERWLGGTLTNFRTVRSRLGRLEELEIEESSGALQEYSKKAIATRTRERKKIYRNLQGVREMNRLPKVLVIIDVSREHIAVREARKLGIPTVCLIDTDSDPDYADIPIPGNDDAIRSIDTVLRHLAEAVELGKKTRPEKVEPKDEPNTPKRRSKRVMARAEGDDPAADKPAVPAAPEAAPSPSATESAS